MKPRFQRGIARHVCNLLHVVSPTKYKRWCEALRVEVDAIADDYEAMQFAIGGFCGLLLRLMLAHFQALLLAISRSGDSSGHTSAIGASLNSFQRPRVVGVMSAVIAVLLGLAYMAAAGAPFSMLASNLGALLLGLAALALIVRIPLIKGRRAGAGALVMAAILLFTSVFGNSVEGAKRWVLVGPFLFKQACYSCP